MPVKKVTSVMFGGPNLDILYVTSMAKPPLPRFPGDGVLRGSLFAITGLGITRRAGTALRRVDAHAAPARNSAPARLCDRHDRAGRSHAGFRNGRLR